MIFLKFMELTIIHTMVWSSRLYTYNGFSKSSYKAIDFSEKSSGMNIFNIGTGYGVSVFELIKNLKLQV